jgi:hypothetical protein
MFQAWRGAMRCILYLTCIQGQPQSWRVLAGRSRFSRRPWLRFCFNSWAEPSETIVLPRRPTRCLEVHILCVLRSALSGFALEYVLGLVNC